MWLVKATALSLYLKEKDPIGVLIQKIGWFSEPVWTSKENLSNRVSNPSPSSP
jgi:hypothetical protein